MIEIQNNKLVFSFPELEEKLTTAFETVANEECAKLGVSKENVRLQLSWLKDKLTTTRTDVDFQRTLRLPDDGREYPLPAGLGSFPLAHVEDYRKRLPKKWVDHGGTLFPMYPFEAMWMHFSGNYPMALKIATGKVCCVTGERWIIGLKSNPQNYLTLPRQPWIDGYVVEKGTVRQFVAVSSGSGASVEEQITGTNDWIGIQLHMFPLRLEVYEEEVLRPALEQKVQDFLESERSIARREAEHCCMARPAFQEMGLAAGGKMKQEIYEDRYSAQDYDLGRSSRCFNHILNAEDWTQVTGQPKPSSPISKSSYEKRGIPWFLHYSSAKGVEAQDTLKGIKSFEEKLLSGSKGLNDGNW